MKKYISLLILAIISLIASTAVQAGETYRYLWSHYTGWEFWQYIQDSGIMKKHADKNGVKVEIVLINDYVASINQYTAGSAVGLIRTFWSSATTRMATTGSFS